MINNKFLKKIIDDIKKHKAIYLILSTILVAYLLQNLYSLKSFLSFRAAKLSLVNMQTLLTYALAHKNLSHLLGNSIGILFFGRFCEKKLNTRNTLLLFLLAVIIPPILLYFLYIFGTNSGGIVGASSGIMGWAGFIIYEIIFSNEKKFIEKLKNFRKYSYQIFIWILSISYLISSFISPTPGSWGHGIGIGVGMVYFVYLNYF